LRKKAYRVMSGGFSGFVAAGACAAAEDGMHGLGRGIASLAQDPAGQGASPSRGAETEHAAGWGRIGVMWGKKAAGIRLVRRRKQSNSAPVTSRDRACCIATINRYPCHCRFKPTPQ